MVIPSANCCPLETRMGRCPVIFVLHQGAALDPELTLLTDLRLRPRSFSTGGASSRTSDWRDSRSVGPRLTRFRPKAGRASPGYPIGASWSPSASWSSLGPPFDVAAGRRGTYANVGLALARVKGGGKVDHVGGSADLLSVVPFGVFVCSSALRSSLAPVSPGSRGASVPGRVGAASAGPWPLSGGCVPW